MIKTFNEHKSISENLQYHLDNSKPITENIFRPGSEAFYEILKEARKLFDSNDVELCDIDREIFESTDIGKFTIFKGELVPLDIPMEYIHELNEAEYKGKEVKLNHPMRGGTKKYYVYVKNPKTGNVKKIAFGDVHGGLTAKVSNPEARKAFAARHKCSTKKDKTKAGYWACRVNKYGHLWVEKLIRDIGNMKYIKSFLESIDIEFNTSVTRIENDTIYFDNGIKLSYYHASDCCEHHWLDFTHIELSDFDGLIFDLSNDDFFERIPNYGIALKPLNGYPVRIPGYGNNNGYYSDNLSLILTDSSDNTVRTFDISDCQEISG